MGEVDVKPYLTPVSAESPSGPDLEYDDRFRLLREAATGTPAGQFGGDAHPPNWREVERLALEMLGVSRDLRAAVLLTEAWTTNDGLPGLARGLEFIAGLTEHLWDTVHPQLDAEDNNDPTRRALSLARLSAGAHVVLAIRNAPLVRSRAMGPVTLRHYELVNKQIEPRPEDTVPEPGALSAAFTEAGYEAVNAAVTALGRALAAVQTIERVFAERAGSQNGPDLDGLKEVLTRLSAVLTPEAIRLAPADEAAGGDLMAGDAAGGPGAARAAGGGPIRGRDDVRRALGEICKWYDQNEPSSPVPILLRRARRLVSANFLDIVRDLAPDGMSQVEKLRGSGDDE